MRATRWIGAAVVAVAIAAEAVVVRAAEGAPAVTVGPAAPLRKGGTQ